MVVEWWWIAMVVEWCWSGDGGGGGLRWLWIAMVVVCDGCGLRWWWFAMVVVCDGAGLRWLWIVKPRKRNNARLVHAFVCISTTREHYN